MATFGKKKKKMYMIAYVTVKPGQTNFLTRFSNYIYIYICQGIYICPVTKKLLSGKATCESKWIPMALFVPWISGQYAGLNPKVFASIFAVTVGWKPSWKFEASSFCLGEGDI